MTPIMNTSVLQLKRRDDTKMNQVLNSKITMLIIGCLLAMISYFLVKRDNVIDRNAAAIITSAQTLINISAQIKELDIENKTQTKVMNNLVDKYEKQEKAYRSLDKKMDKTNHNLNDFCNATKQYEGWVTHKCDYE